jgi:DNA mismatch endonuclease (patch repair protein)
MADVFTAKKRSSIMSMNRGTGNRSTEWRLRARLVAAKISGWRVNAKDVYGRPDFVFDNEKIAIFVDGCFWHGCAKHRNIPATNHEFWLNKIEGNRRRDRVVVRKLRKEGWGVIRFWEHQVRTEPEKCLGKILTALAKFEAQSSSASNGK